jgi:hypothetical protein
LSTTSRDLESLARAVIGARTVKDVDGVVAMAQELYGPLCFRPVGGRPNNIGTIGLGSDPALGVVERVTNAMDAMLDLARLQHRDDTPGSPREAARMWFGVPTTGVADMTEGERRKLGQNIQVWLDESGDEKRPTVVVEDRGIGQAPPDFPQTLLSLNEQNKVGQAWNMGTYGQGGSVTFMASEATVILSRRHPDFRGQHRDSVGWTVVRRHVDPATQALPSYQYIVDSTERVLELSPELLPDFAHGTRIRHVAYDLHGWTGPFTTGLWQFLHSALFDPILPFLVTGKRNKEKDYGSRIVIGNAARLERPDRARGDVEIAHKESVRYDLPRRLGSVKFNYWVIRRPPDSSVASDPTAGYGRADSAVSITLFGQRQDAEPRTWIKDNAKYPFLYKKMLVQIDADGLTPLAKGEIFASTRERARKGDLRALIYESLAEVLRNDDELRRLNHEEKERLLARSTEAASDKVRQRLARFIRTRIKEVQRPGTGGTRAGSAGARRKPSGRPSTARNVDDSDLPRVPTRFAFSSEHVRVAQGARSHTWVELNAKNGYLPEHDDALTLFWANGDADGGVRVPMRSRLIGGRSRWYLEAAMDAPLGNYPLTASLLTANAVLTAETVVSVVAPPTARAQALGTEPEVGPQVKWVLRENWAEHQGRLDGRAVGYVTEDEEETIIWVNRHLDLLERALAPRHLTPEVIRTRATRYQYPIACALWLQEHALQTAEPRPSEAYQKEELRRAAEAVLVAIDPDADVSAEEAED